MKIVYNRNTCLENRLISTILVYEYTHYRQTLKILQTQYLCYANGNTLYSHLEYLIQHYINQSLIKMLNFVTRINDLIIWHCGVV